MARQRNAPAEPVEPPDGAFILPDPEAFTRQKPARTVDDPTRQAGRVIGLDYTQWAVATVVLDSAKILKPSAIIRPTVRRSDS